MAFIDIVLTFARMIIAFIVVIGITTIMVASIVDIFVEATPLSFLTLKKLALDLLKKANETDNAFTKIFAIFLLYFRWLLILALDIFIIWVMLNFNWFPPWLTSWIRSVFPF